MSARPQQAGSERGRAAALADMGIGQSGTAPGPPYSNRGVTFTPVEENQSLSGFAFDAYSASVFADPHHLLDYLEQALLEAGFETHRADGPPVRFYDRNALILDSNGHRLLSVRYGGQNGTPFVECKGPPSIAVAAELREHFQQHFPSRIDSAIDLRGEGVFDKLLALSRSVEASGIKLDLWGAEPSNPDRGTTIYLGSRSSPLFVRSYQKGLKHAEEMGLSGADIPDDLRHWVRVELEFKPQKRPAKIRARSLSPRALWGCSPWVRRFAMDALSIDAERITMHEKRESNLDRSFRYSAAQFGPTHLQMIERIGLDAYLERWLHMIGHAQGARQDAA